MTNYSKLLKHIAIKVGKSIDEIKAMSPYELRFYLEKKNHKKITFNSEFPFIGRGNVLRDSIKSTQEINKIIDNMLKNA